MGKCPAADFDLSQDGILGLSQERHAASVGKPWNMLSDPDVVRVLHRFVSLASLFSLAAGILGLAGWMSRIAVLKSVIPGGVIIKPNATVCLVMIGSSLWLLREKDRQPFSGIKQRSGQLLATITAVVGLLSLTEHLFGWDLGIDQLLFLDEDPWEAFGSVRPGLMAPITALDFSLLGLALLLLDWTITWRSRGYWPAQFFALAAGIGSIVGLLDFILRSLTSYTHVALQTAVALLLLSCSVVCARPERGLAALIASSRLGGTITRRLLPAAIIVPVLIGALSWKASFTGLTSEWGDVTLMIVAMIVLLAGLTVWNGYRIDRSDAERRQAEGALHEREEELREAQRLARVGSWWWDTRADSVTWSEELYRIAGRDPKLPAPGYQEHSRFFTPQSFTRLNAAVEEAIQTGTPYEVDLEMVRADGVVRSVTGRGEVQRDADGQVVLVRGTVQDITERKQADEALQKSAEEIRDLYNRAPCGYHSLDKDGVFVRINDTELDWLGYARNEVIGKMHFSDLLTAEGLKTFGKWFPRLKAEGMIQDVEFELLRKNGSSLPVLLSATAITDRHGHYVMSRSTLYNMTERKRTEAALRQSQVNLNRAQAVAHIGSWYLDVPQNRLTWSDEVFRMFGVPKGTGLTYEAFVSMVHPEDRERIDQAWTAALRGAPYDIEHRIVVGGELKWVRERAQVEFDKDGNPVEGIGTVQDITERKRVEKELLRVNRAHRALSSCNQALLRATDESVWLQEVCRVIVNEAGYRLCWVGYAEPDDAKTVRPVAQAGFDEGYVQMVNVTWADTEHGRGPTGTCIRTGQTQVVTDVATNPRFAPWRSEALKRGYASIIAIPIVVDSELFGALTIYSSETEAFRDEEVMLLSELAADLGYGITTLRTRAERERAEEEIRTLNAELEQRVTARTAELQAANQLKDQLLARQDEAAAELLEAREREIKIGFRIQQMLLLDQPPQDVPGFRIAALSIPSQQIDGDFYHFFKHENQCLDLIVADVMGKGIPAALLGAATKSHFTEALCHLMAMSMNGELPEPREIVAAAHADMVRQLIDLESFVTLCYARLDLGKQSVDLVDCGHTGVIHWRSRTGLCEMLHGDNLPLGIREGEIYDQFSGLFETGDVLLFYSDGVTEARNPAGELFGPDRLAECVRSNSGLEPEALVDAVRTAVLTFSHADGLSDDLTCVAIKVEEQAVPVARADIEIDSDPRDLHRARQFVRTFCSALPGSPLVDDRVAELVLAVNEAASNIMKHAYHGRADQRIHLEAVALSGRVSIRLHHLGDPFDPSAAPAPPLDGSRESGFGVYLITKSVDEVRYCRDERGRHCIVLAKLCKT